MAATYEEYLSSRPSGVEKQAAGPGTGTGATYEEYLSGAPLSPLAETEQPEEGSGIGLSNFLNVIPGVETARTAVLQPIAESVRKKSRETTMELPFPEAGTALQRAANTASIPIKSIAAALDELIAENVESLPETLALSGVGKAARAAQLVPKAKEALEAFKLANPGIGNVIGKFQFRGGMTPASKEAFGVFDVAERKGKQEALETGEELLTGGTGKALSTAEQQTMGTLMQQPEMTEMMRMVNATEYPANRAAILESVTPVAGRPGFSPVLAQPEEMTLEPNVYADVAARAAAKLGMKKSKMIELGIKDPSYFARFNEGEYAPLMYRQKKIGIMPTVQSSIRERTGFLKMRKDLLEEERAKLGLIEEPSAPVSIRLAQEDHLINTRMLFNTLASDPEVVRPVTELDEGVAVGMRALDGFVRMPGDKELGPLAGMMVRKAEADEINSIARMSQPGALMRVWKPIFASWRFGKAVLSPATQVNNLASNIMLADARGLSPWRMDIYGEAARNMGRGGEYWNELKLAAAPWLQNSGTRLAGDVLDLQRSLGPGRADNMFEQYARSFHRIVTDNAISRKAADLYQGTEALFKTAVYIARRKAGDSVTEAIQVADEALFNYDNVPLWVKQVRSTSVPFVTFTYKVIPAVARAIVERPVVFLRWKLFMDSWNHVAAESAGISDKERQEILSFFPGSIPMIMPFRSSTGSPMVLDAARKTPIQDILPGRPGSLFGSDTGLPEAMLGLPLKNPALQEVLSQTLGRDVATGQEFAPQIGQLSSASAKAKALGVDEQTWQDIENMIGSLPGRAKHAARTALPELSGGGATQNILAAISGKSDIFGEPISPLRAILESVAGKTRSLSEAQLGAGRDIEDLIALAQRQAARTARGAQ